MTKSGNGVLVAAVLSAALRRKADRALEEELRALGEVELPAGAEERIWARILRELEAG